MMDNNTVDGDRMINEENMMVMVMIVDVASLYVFLSYPTGSSCILLLVVVVVTAEDFFNYFFSSSSFCIYTINHNHYVTMITMLLLL